MVITFTVIRIMMIASPTLSDLRLIITLRDFHSHFKDKNLKLSQSKQPAQGHVT